MNLRASWTAILILAALLWPAQPSAETQQHSYAYDATGRLIEVSYGNGAVLSYSYDANGNLTGVAAVLSDELFANGFEEGTP